MNVVVVRGLKRIWDSKWENLLQRGLQKDVYLELKALEIVYRANGAAVEGLAGRNGHRQTMVGKGKSISWGGERKKGKG